MDITRLLEGDRELTDADLMLLEETALAVAQSTIQNAINDAGLSRAEVARRMRCQRSYVTRILQGDHNLTIKTLARALGACGQELKLGATEPQCAWTSQPHMPLERAIEDGGAAHRQAPPQLAFAA